jgi:hypothetical protein
MTAAISQQQKIGLAVVAVMVVGWFVYLLVAARRTYDPGSELELAPNRKPYLDDDELEGPKLEQALTLALVMLVVIGIGLPL